jgi:hypothetical protein
MSKGGVPGSGTVSQTKDDEGTPPACSDSTQSKTNATDKDDERVGLSLTKAPFQPTALLTLAHLSVVILGLDPRIQSPTTGFVRTAKTRNPAPKGTGLLFPAWEAE